MEYRALYRKYRPDNFDAVVGQIAIIRTLQNIVKENKISHAYLFSGPRGTGKTSVAKLFAKAINCIEPIEGMPCGKCTICNQIKEDRVNDIIEIDAASNNGVDEIRDLKSKINLTPTICKYKVYIIDEVHMLSIGAFNALLKTLEEPPHHAVFILATTEMHKLPLTIISRCQNFNFKKITEDQMELRLKYIADEEHINIENEAVSTIAKVADGGMRDAIGLLEQLHSFTENNITVRDVELLSSSVSRDDIVDLLSSVVSNNVEAIFMAIDRFYQEGKDFVRISENLVIFLKDVLIYKKAKNYFKTMNSYNIEKYHIINKLEDNFIYNMISDFNKMIGELKITSHPKIIFEIMLLKLVDTEQTTVNVVEEKTTTVIKLEELKKEEITPPLVVEDDLPAEVEAVIKAEMDAEIENKPDEVEEIEWEGTDPLPFVKIPLYKKIIINNTLAMAEKELLTDLKTKCDQLQTFLLNKDFKQAATVLLDGKIVGASKDNIIYTYPYDSLVDKADNICDEINGLINNMMGSKYKVVHIADESWSEIRPYYIKLMKDKKKIDILPEISMSISKKNSKVKKRSKEMEDAITMFGEDIVEIN